MKILIVPDIHLGKSANLGKEDLSGNNSRIEDQKKLLYFTLDKALENNVDRMVLTGDIFDHTNPKPNLVVLFMEWLSKCTKKFPVDIILGNHDFTRTDKNKVSILDCLSAIKLDNCSVIKEIEQKQYDDLSITYLPFMDRRQLSKDTAQEAIDYIKNKIDKQKDIAIGHLALQGSFFIGDEVDDDINELFLPLDMFSNFSYVFMGHVHKYQILSSSPHIMHVGSLDKTAFDEGSKFLVLFDSKTGEVEDINLPCRKLVDFVIKIPSDANDTDYIINEIKKIEEDESIKGSIVRLKVETNSIESTIDRKKVNDVLTKLGIHNLSSFTEIRRNEKPIAKNTELDETIDHYKAIDLAVKVLKADEAFINDVAIACKDIIKTIKGKK